MVSLYAFLTVVIELAGIFLALQAVLIARTPQSAIGWAIALVIVPVIAIPLFLVFGESRFSGYTRAGTGGSAALDEALRVTGRHLDGYRAEVSVLCIDGARVAENLSKLPATGGNAVRLLVDGQITAFLLFLQRLGDVARTRPGKVLRKAPDLKLGNTQHLAHIRHRTAGLEG